MKNLLRAIGLSLAITALVLGALILETTQSTIHRNREVVWMDSVVSIAVYKNVNDVLTPVSAGSGFFITSDGLLLTNHHVVKEGTVYYICLHNGEKIKADIFADDAKGDLTLLRAESNEKFTPLELGDSSMLQEGDSVTVIGNPMNIGLSVSTGIVSSKLRYVSGFLYGFVQTDASVNPGNSGGPLLNDCGQVVGINEMILQGPGAGLSFSMNINDVKWDLQTMLSGKNVNHASLGIKFMNKDWDITGKPGVLVKLSTNPAIHADDVVLQVNDQDIMTGTDLQRIMSRVLVGDTVKIRILRDNQLVEKTFSAADFPEPVAVILMLQQH